MKRKTFPSEKYIETSDTIHTDLKHFPDFLYRYFNDKKCFDEIRPVSNQPARFFVTPKIYKSKSLEKLNVDQLKLRLIMDQTGTYTFNT